jgi:hypothetical protein
MPYRTAAFVPAKIHRLWYAPARGIVAPFFALVASIVVALAALGRPSMASVVACSAGTCTVHRAEAPGNWSPIPCADADGLVERLTAFQPFVWHYIYLYDLKNPGASVTVSRARQDLAACVNQESREVAGVYVGDFRYGGSAACVACGLLVAGALLVAARRRGLTIEVDERRRAFRCTDRGWSSPPRSFACDLASIDTIVAEHDADVLEPDARLMCVLGTGERVLLAHGTRARDGKRYARVAARVRTILNRP